MNKDYRQIRNLIDSAQNVLAGIKINYDSTIGPRTTKLLELVRQIVPLINKDYPVISNILENALRHKTFAITKQVQIPHYPFLQNVVNDCINAYSFGDIRTAISILDVLYPSTTNDKFKLFVSYSSKDESIINCFIEKILKLGCGFNRSEIFCTIDHTAIHTGYDFRNEIIKNMKACDYILCFISNNYKESEICQNELGAAWALDNKRVLPFKFPTIKFSDLGFISVVKQAADITDTTKLDELYEELCSYYDINTDWINFNEQKDEFVKLVQNNFRT